jgi:dephospho-CoA kinase
MTSHQPIILALTGGIACGKSETGRILAEEGFAVLDTDLLAHKMMKAGTRVFQKVVNRFGNGVIGGDGELDRASLGKIVFDDRSARNDLNKLVHPAVIQAAEEWKTEQGGDCAVLIPLLFETGWTDGWDAVVCVSADEQSVFQRLEKRGLTAEEARKRVSAQMPLSEKKKKSDFIIVNNETLDELRNETLRVLDAIRSRGNDHE